ELQGNERLDSLQGDLVHQEFFELPPGEYDLSIEARDLNSPDTAVTRYRAPLAIGELPDGVSITDLMFAEKIEPSENGPATKFGYQVVPLISDYFPRELKVLNFYAEIYGTEEHFGKDSLYLLTYQIEGLEDKKVT